LEAIVSVARRVVVLSPDLSANAVGRALVFVDMLTGFRDVALAGPRTGQLWPPLASRSDLRVDELPRNPYTAAKILRSHWSDAIVIASKPILSSYGIALASRCRPIVLDIDDPEFALATADLRTVVSTLPRATNPILTAFLTARRSAANAVTVANRVLQGMYGGSVIPHARDERIFDPTMRDRATSRRALGLPDDGCLVAYVGTIRAHKGVEDLRAAARRLPKGVKLALVGGSQVDGSDNEIIIPPGPYRSTMRWVSAADIVVVPQRPSRVGLAQSPAKLVDALAMGRAIVSTKLAPIQETVGESAVLVEPDSIEDLIRGLGGLIKRPERRVELEALSRARFLESLSFEVIRPQLLRELDRLE
jgi:glycosyltransferase involved in cell wall biosynthesis